MGNADTPNEETVNTPNDGAADEQTNEGADAVDQETESALGDVLDDAGYSPDGEEPDPTDEAGDGDDPADETGDGGGEDPEDTGVEDPGQGDGGDGSALSREQAIDALLASNFTREDILDMSDEQIMKIGARRHAALNPEDTGEAPEGTGGDDPEATDKDGKGGKDDAPAVSDDEVLAAIGEELGDDFDDREKERLGKAILKATSMRAGQAGKFDFTPYQQQIEQQVGELKGMGGTVRAMSNELEVLAIENARLKLADTYPQLEDDSKLEAVVKKAGAYIKQAGSIRDAMEMAAFALYGAEQNQAIQKHKAKVNRAKGRGTTTPRTSVARDNGKSEDDLAAAKIVAQHM